MEKEKGKIAFYINHGVEVRHFILSGLFKTISQTNSATIIMREDVSSEYLEDYLDTSNILYMNIPQKKRHWFEGYATAVRKARLRLNKIGNFHNFNDNPNPNWLKDILLGNKLSFILVSLVARRLLRNHYTDSFIISFLKDKNITMIYMVDYNNPFLLQIGFSANKSGIPVKIITNTLKSFYINDFIPFKADKLFTWNNYQSELFRKSNFHLPAKTFIETGNPYHNFIFSEADFSLIDEELKLLANHPFILYSLIFDKIYDKEFEVLKLINSFINETFQTDKPKIVIRRNPFEEVDFNIEQFKTLDNIIIAPHSWERKVQYSWSIQAYKGELEWKFLLEKSKLLINITSMAGIEAIFSGTPLINIGFNGEGKEEVKITRFTNAPFLNDILISKYVKRALNKQEFESCFKKLYPVKLDIEKIDIQKSINIRMFNNEMLHNIHCN